LTERIKSETGAPGGNWSTDSWLNIDFHHFDANRAHISGWAGENQAAQAV